MLLRSFEQNYHRIPSSRAWLLGVEYGITMPVMRGSMRGIVSGNHFRAISSLFAVCAAHQGESSDSATLKAFLNFEVEQPLQS